MRNIVLALSIAALCACNTPGDPMGPGPARPSALAHVDGEAVSMDGYRTWLADVYGKQARDEYVGLWLLEREAKKRGLSVSEQEIDSALQTLWDGWIKDRLKGETAALDVELQRQGHDRESYRRWFHWQKRRELLATRVVHLERTIGEESVQRSFEQRYGPKGVRTQVRVLVLTRARLTQELARDSGGRALTAGELDERLMEKALALRARVLAGESFESVVRAESNDPAVRKDFGVYRDEQWRLRGAALVRAVEQAEPHVVQPPVKNSSGVDLFEVLARETTRLQDVREKLVAELAAEPASLEEITALDRRLREASRIEFP